MKYRPPRARERLGELAPGGAEDVVGAKHEAIGVVFYGLDEVGMEGAVHSAPCGVMALWAALCVMALWRVWAVLRYGVWRYGVMTFEDELS